MRKFDDESIKDELYGKMKKLGKELDSVKAEIKDIERAIELYSVKPDITRTRINRELEDLCKLQSGLTDLEKREILAMVVDKIVLKTEVEHTKLSRTMSMTIYPKAEFANRIPPTPIRFNINSHSAVCNWHIHGLGIKANRDKLMAQRIGTGYMMCSNGRRRLRQINFPSVNLLTSINCRNRCCRKNYHF